MMSLMRLTTSGLVKAKFAGLTAFRYWSSRKRTVAFADLGMEAIYEFDVQDMPVTVAVDSQGTSVHNTGPKEWQARIGKIPVVVA
mgnify:CR=1 FL=1